MCAKEGLQDWETMRLLSTKNMQHFLTPLFVILSFKKEKKYCVSVSLLHSLYVSSLSTDQL